MNSKQLASKLAHLTLSKKATDIRVLDLRKLTAITDFFVICTGSSDTHVKAISDAVVDGSNKLGEKPWHREGTGGKSWVLLDYVDVVVHIFLNETRRFYSLEKLWGDAEITSVSD